MSDYPVYSHYTYGSIALVALFPFYMYIRISAGCISNLILSVGASAGSVKSFPGDSVRPSARVSYIFPPRRRVHSEKYIRRERERRRENKKDKLVVCTRSFLSGRRWVAQEIRWNFAQNGKRAAGVLGYANSEIRDFMNDKALRVGRLIVERKVRQRDEKRQGQRRKRAERASERARYRLAV